MFIPTLCLANFPTSSSLFLKPPMSSCTHVKGITKPRKHDLFFKYSPDALNLVKMADGRKRAAWAWNMLKRVQTEMPRREIFAAQMIYYQDTNIISPFTIFKSSPFCP